MIINGQKVNPEQIMLNMVKVDCKGCGFSVFIFPTDQKSLEEFYCSACKKAEQSKLENETQEQIKEQTN